MLFLTIFSPNLRKKSQEKKYLYSEIYYCEVDEKRITEEMVKTREYTYKIHFVKNYTTLEKQIHFIERRKKNLASAANAHF